MIIGIDTSKDKRLIAVVFGSNENIFKTYKLLEKEFKKLNWEPPLHWKKIKKESKKKILNNVSKTINSSSLKIWVFECKKPRQETRKKYYLKLCPNSIAYSFEPLIKNCKGILQIQADKDFGIKKSNGTQEFLENLVLQTAFRQIGSTPKIFKRKNFLRTELKKGKDKLEIIANPVSSETSKAVQIADLTLGVYNFNKKKLKINFKKV